MSTNVLLYTQRRCVKIPALSEIQTIVDGVYEQLPSLYRKKSDTVRVIVENFPTQDILDSLNLKNRFDLLGLYRGVPLSVSEGIKVTYDENVIFLFRAPMIKYAREKGEVFEELVSHVLLHEMRHHFGASQPIRLKSEQQL